MHRRCKWCRGMAFVLPGKPAIPPAETRELEPHHQLSHSGRKRRLPSAGLPVTTIRNTKRKQDDGSVAFNSYDTRAPSTLDFELRFCFWATGIEAYSNNVLLKSQDGQKPRTDENFTCWWSKATPRAETIPECLCAPLSFPGGAKSALVLTDNLLQLLLVRRVRPAVSVPKSPWERQRQPGPGANNG